MSEMLLHSISKQAANRDPSGPVGTNPRARTVKLTNVPIRGSGLRPLVIVERIFGGTHRSVTAEASGKPPPLKVVQAASPRGPDKPGSKPARNVLTKPRPSITPKKPPFKVPFAIMPFSTRARKDSSVVPVKKALQIPQPKVKVLFRVPKFVTPPRIASRQPPPNCNISPPQKKIHFFTPPTIQPIRKAKPTLTTLPMQPSRVRLGSTAYKSSAVKTSVPLEPSPSQLGAPVASRKNLTRSEATSNLCTTPNSALSSASLNILLSMRSPSPRSASTSVPLDQLVDEIMIVADKMTISKCRPKRGIADLAKIKQVPARPVTLKAAELNGFVECGEETVQPVQVAEQRNLNVWQPLAPTSADFQSMQAGSILLFDHARAALSVDGKESGDIEGAAMELEVSGTPCEKISETVTVVHEEVPLSIVNVAIRGKVEGTSIKDADSIVEEIRFELEHGTAISDTGTMDDDAIKVVQGPVPVVLGNPTQRTNVSRGQDNQLGANIEPKVFLRRATIKGKSDPSGLMPPSASILSTKTNMPALPVTPRLTSSSLQSRTAIGVTPQNQEKYVTESVKTPSGTRRLRRLVVPPMDENSVVSPNARIQMEVMSLRKQRKVGGGLLTVAPEGVALSLSSLAIKK